MLKTIPGHVYLISTGNRLEMVLDTLYTDLGLGLEARDLETFRSTALYLFKEFSL